MAGWFLKQGSPVGLGLTKVKLCWGTEPEAPQIKKSNGGSDHGPELSLLDSHSWTCQDSVPEHESGTQLAPSLRWLQPQCVLPVNDTGLQFFPLASLA